MADMLFSLEACPVSLSPYCAPVLGILAWLLLIIDLVKTNGLRVDMVPESGRIIR